MTRPRTPVGTWGAVGYDRLPTGKTRARAQYRGVDGRSRRISATGKNRTEASARLSAKLHAAVGLGGDEHVGPWTTVEHLAGLWLAEVEQTSVRPQTLARYRAVVARHVVPAIGAMAVCEVRVATIEQLLRRVDEVAPGQVLHLRTTLRRIMGAAVRHQAIPVNPVDAALAPAKRKREVVTMSDAEIAALRRQAVGHPDWRLAVAVDLMIALGLRIGEAAALTWADVDTSASPVRVSVRATMVQAPGALVRQNVPKTDSSRRTLFAPDFLGRRLRELAGEPHLPVLPTRSGAHMSPSNLRRSLAALRAAAGIRPEVTPHAMRRTLATKIARTAGLEAASSQLGHKGITVTVGHYVAPEHDGPQLAPMIETWLVGA